jgi:hypothetical protein
MVGAAVGGGIMVALGIAVAIRFRIVSAQFNTNQRVSSWRSGSKKARRIPEMEIGTNPIVTNPSFTLRSQRVQKNQHQEPIDIVPV